MNILRLASLATLLALTACGGGGGSNGGGNNPVNPPPPADINLTGVVLDGPVAGGTIFVFPAATVQAALAAAGDAEDRVAALSARDPVATLERGADGDETFSLTIPGDRANQVLFLLFDGTDAEDGTFGGEPFDMESVIQVGDAGSSAVANITPHTTLIAVQARAAIDPDGDGTVVQDEVLAAITDAIAATVGAFNTNDLGERVLADDVDPVTSTDLENLTAASVSVARLVRLAAALADTDAEAVLDALGADLLDGNLDGNAGSDVDTDTAELVATIAQAAELGAPEDAEVEAVSCAAAAHQLRRACEFEALDEFMVSKAICADTGSEDAFSTCSAALQTPLDEALEECGDITEARIELCDEFDDAPHAPAFGPAFAASFVDPAAIGDTVDVNPLLPLQVGNRWVYEGTFEEDGELVTEVITIVVEDKIKLVDGIPCRVVRDTVTVDDELVEDTNDWFAQDVDGNVWYCGEEVKDYETFDGDEPPLPELVAIDGAFKAGREGDKAGIQLPGDPEVGDFFRQEQSLANAEDAIEILAVDGSATTPAAVCTGNCVVTRDFSPLDPGVEENKYYLPGIGKILEIKVETGNRVELVETNVTP
ncbi:MAG: hypothetical protein H6993_15045 [Pseudomonadales bacterium]|nr:hypothetical protein [Pseudomonadales bacterium]